MSVFYFQDYSFDGQLASFRYRYEDINYEECVKFETSKTYDRALFDRVLFLAFLVIGTSYYKSFPTRQVEFENHEIDEMQARFCNQVYQEGLSQFAYENNLTRSDLAHFTANTKLSMKRPLNYSGQGIVSLQSGGKDSLLVASLLDEKKIDYTPWHVAQGPSHPALLSMLSKPLVVAKRTIDTSALGKAVDRGAKNGHVPVTYIMLALSIAQAILLGKNTILAAIGHEGEEPHAQIGDLAVTHQWSKTWSAEQLLANYVHQYISPDIQIGSPLRQYSELKIAELFTKHTWEKFGQSFSSCNVANYKQGAENTRLTWCGNCPKCANSYLLFAPFISPAELQTRFGCDLFQKASLVEMFKGLLGVDGVIKPFECVGEVDELRAAYHLAQANGYQSLSFQVPTSGFNYDILYRAQMQLASILQ